jgi:NAD(P)-dependent dehydrogenase (short-subunit alcohol dehydrogenase family)
MAEGGNYPTIENHLLDLCVSVVVSFNNFFFQEIKMSSEYLQQLFGLDGQTAVVIGGAGVLGGALCGGLVQAGARVIVADVTDDPCKARVAELEKLGGKADYVLVDVTSRGSIDNLLAKSVEKAGRVHVLVNGAGVNAGSDFLDATDADWDRIMTINLRGTFQACQVFGRHMVEQGGGSIVNIGSVNSHLPLSRVFAYGASKAAVLNLSRNIAHDFGTKGVRVNVLCPGFFPAEQNRKLLTKERVESIMSHTPMKRFGEPEELIGALLLMVSSKAGSFITGAPINVDGGFTAAWL